MLDLIAASDQYFRVIAEVCSVLLPQGEFSGGNLIQMLFKWRAWTCLPICRHTRDFVK